MANVSITSLNAGEMSKKVDARSDLDRYSAGCRHLENMLVTIYGGVEKRPGTEHVYASSVPTGSPP